MAFITFVIPCYNVLSTIERTLQSLESQSLNDFSVILIDDGSKDDISHIISRYLCLGQSQIEYYRQDNSGVAVARNNGIEHCKSEYICFLDGDDTLHPQFVEIMYYLSKNSNVDAIISYQERDIDKMKNVRYNISQLKDCRPLSPVDLLSTFMYNKEHIHFGGILYRREILDMWDIRFSSGVKYGEDLEFAWKYLSHCNSGVAIECKLYGYYNNPNSAINTVKWEKIHLADAMIRVKNYLYTHDHTFAESFSNYMLPRSIWTVVKTFAVGKRSDYYWKFISEYDAKSYLKKLIRSSRNSLLCVSSLIFCISPALFYYIIRIVYKNKK